MSAFHLSSLVSPARLSTYAKLTENDSDKAAILYQFNIQLSESLYPLLSIFEITLRNKMSKIFVQEFGDEWFIGEQDEWLYSQKTKKSHELDKIKETIQDLSKNNKSVDSDSITANLSFGFWTGMLHRKYADKIWKLNLKKLFFNANFGDLKPIRDRLNRIRELRNRISHHEPLFGTQNQCLSDLICDYYHTKKYLSWLSQDACAFLEKLDRFSDCIKWIPEPIIDYSKENSIIQVHGRYKLSKRLSDEGILCHFDFNNYF